MNLASRLRFLSGSGPGVAVFGVMLVIFLYAIDGTVVSTAMPTVVARLGDIELYSWVFSIYMLTSALATLASMGVFGVITYLPLHVQGVLGGTASHAGTVLLLASLGWTGGSVTAGQGMNRFGYRAVCLAGMGLMAFGYGLFLGLETHGGIVIATLAGIIVCIGMGMTNVTALVASQNAVPVRRIGVATSTVMLFRTFGGAFGVSLMGSVLITQMHRQLVALSGRAGVDLSKADIERFANPQNLMEPSARLGIPDRLLPLLIDALGQSIWYAFMAGLVLMLLGVCASFWMDPRTPAATTRPAVSNAAPD